MSTLTHPTGTAVPSTSRYWLAAVIAIVGLVVGVAFGVMSYRDSQAALTTSTECRFPAR